MINIHANRVVNIITVNMSMRWLVVKIEWIFQLNGFQLNFMATNYILGGGGDFKIDAICELLFNPLTRTPGRYQVNFVTKGWPERFMFVIEPIASLEKRRNQDVARQSKKPTRIRKSQFVRCTTLRAFRCLQPRRLCVSLRDRAISQTHRAVQVIWHCLIDCYLTLEHYPIMCGNSGYI